MSLKESDVLSALSKVRYPGFTRDIVASGVIREVRVAGADVALELSLHDAPPRVAEQIRREAEQAVRGLAGVDRISVRVSGAQQPGADALKVVGSKPSVAAAGALNRGLLPGVRHTIAVASGKGGVGKSTVAVNLALALGRGGARVGLLDADVYGPSIPLMVGCLHERPQLDRLSQQILTIERFGVRFMSLGFLVDPQSAVIWRGPLVIKAIEQMLGEVAWGDLDVLVVDMPPGTGDAQLTLAQKVQLAGAVIVTTPQDVALADAIKGVAMFRKVDVPVLGLVENMSYFVCPDCGHRAEIFGHGGGRAEAERMQVPFLGEVPLDPEIRSGGDTGHPIVASAPDSPQTAAFMEIAGRVLERLEPARHATDDEPAGNSLFERFRSVWDRDAT